ncbi:hypothetical protein [Caldimonas sp. KR1-144]
MSAALRRAWCAALFFVAGLASELRSPLNCQTVPSRGSAVALRRDAR